VLGFAFSLQAITVLNLGSYKVGCILLVWRVREEGRREGLREGEGGLREGERG
jgi:hypothetical protein